MRIAYICMDPGIPVFGQKGCSVHVQEVIRSFTSLGAKVELFAVRTGGSPPPGLENVVLHKLASLPKGDLARREQAAMAMNQELHKSLDTAGDFDMVYERYSLWSFSGMEYAARYRIPGVLEVNAPLIEEQAKHRGLVNKKAAEEVAGMVFSTASALVCVSEEVANYIIKLEGDNVRPKVHVIPNGINPECYLDIHEKSQAHDDVFVIGFVGTLKPWHGLPYLLEAFAGFHTDNPDTRLCVVGDGPQREEILAMSEKYGISNAIDMAGSVSPEEVPGWLASMDVAVAPYPDLKDFYFSPLKVYEYMAAGLPVIASRIGQLEKLITHGINGIHSEPGSVISIKQSLRHLYDNSALRKNMGHKARETVLQNHTWDHVTGQILRIAEESIIRQETHAESV